MIDMTTNVNSQVFSQNIPTLLCYSEPSAAEVARFKVGNMFVHNLAFNLFRFLPGFH